MVTKMSDVYSNVNTEKNVFYSAYLKGKVQYNDVDPDKIKTLIVHLKIEDEKKDDYSAVSEVPGIELATIKTEEKEKEKEKEEKETGKIVVINYDISSNPSSPISSSNDLQKLEQGDSV